MNLIHATVQKKRDNRSDCKTSELSISEALKLIIGIRDKYTKWIEEKDNGQK